MSYRVTNAGEVGDEEGGGASTERSRAASAGYYNTVGSAEGWTGARHLHQGWPAAAAAASSRGGAGGYLSGRVQQRPEDFFDEEDDVLSGQALRLTSAYNHRGRGATQLTAANGRSWRTQDRARASSSSSSFLSSFMQREDSRPSVGTPAGATSLIRNDSTIPGLAALDMFQQQQQQQQTLGMSSLGAPASSHGLAGG